MAASVDQFGKSLVASGLMTADEVKAFGPRLPPRRGRKLATALRSRWSTGSKLTDFQAEATPLGRTRGGIMGDYAITAKIGEGGHGRTVTSEAQADERFVALKLMSPPR